MNIQTAILNSSVGLGLLAAGCACGRIPDQAQLTPKQATVQRGAAAQKFAASPPLVVPQFGKPAPAPPEQYQTEGPAQMTVTAPQDDSYVADDARILPPRSFRAPSQAPGASPGLTAAPKGRMRRAGQRGDGWTGSRAEGSGMGPTSKATQSSSNDVIGIS